MNLKVTCRRTSDDKHSFFLNVCNNNYFLFSQDYLKSVEKYYGNGISVNQAVCQGSSSDAIVKKTARRIRHAIKVLERECNIIILDKTAKKFFKKPSIRYARMEGRMKGYTTELMCA